ncbi:MAG: hypothetical protein QOI54_1750 [Actinomycetota bacterium]|nr:hypothetical protein [Actinomycetota bacterium]
MVFLGPPGTMPVMRLGTLRRSRKPPVLPGLHGVARLDAVRRDPAARELSARELAKRLRPGEIAVIDHLDLDKVTAELLLAARPAAVVNAAASTSGRYPNLGPEIVVSAGIPLLDRVGPDALRGLVDGERLRLDGDTLYRGEDPIARGDLLTVQTVQSAMDRARDGLMFQLRAFAANATEHLGSERDLLLDGAGVPELRTPIEGRPVLVVVRGSGWRQDLAGLRGYLREMDPVLVGVDEGADALIETGHRPDIVVGDLTEVSDAALTCGAELVLHVSRDGRAPARARLDELGAEHAVFTATGTGEDLALLLADSAGASVIVLAGSHASLREFIDHSRDEMPGTFLTRLRVGTTLVDARAVAQIYRHRVATWPLLLLLSVAIGALVAALVLTGVQGFAGTPLGDWWDSAVTWVQQGVGGR